MTPLLENIFGNRYKNLVMATCYEIIRSLPPQNDRLGAVAAVSRRSDNHRTRLLSPVKGEIINNLVGSF
jgi:hypothetical protein